MPYTTYLNVLYTLYINIKHEKKYTNFQQFVLLLETLVSSI